MSRLIRKVCRAGHTGLRTGVAGEEGAKLAIL
jgi:hypothetical protein